MITRNPEFELLSLLCVKRKHNSTSSCLIGVSDQHFRTSVLLALHCIALHCIALHCIALHCITLHLHYITIYYITSHWSPIRWRPGGEDGRQEGRAHNGQGVKCRAEGDVACLAAALALLAAGSGGGALPLHDARGGSGCLGLFASRGCVPDLFELRECTAVCQCLEVPDFPGQPLEVLWLRILHGRTDGQDPIEVGKQSGGMQECFYYRRLP
jgi:hypothetical protein